MAALTENITTDLVIVGGGGAGVACAISAAQNGLKDIVLIEKAGSVAGSTSMAHDIFGADSPVQERMGIDASKDKLFKLAMDWDHYNGADPRLLRALIDKSGDTIRWMEEMGIEFELGQFLVNQVPRVRHTVLGHGTALMKILREKAESLGVKVFTKTRGRKILRGPDGKATGVVVVAKKQEFTIEAKAVAITSGGYGANKEMLKKHVPFYNENIQYDGLPSNTGDGHAMAVEAGADMEQVGRLVLHGPWLDPRFSPGFQLDAMGPGHMRMDGMPVFMNLLYVAWEPQIIWVNKRGRRFVDEAHDGLAFFATGAACARQPESTVYSLFDFETLKEMEDKGLQRVRNCVNAIWIPMIPASPLQGLMREVDNQAGKGELVKSDSWDEIAAFIGCDPVVLKATVDEQNAAFDTGRDSMFVKDKKYIRPLRTPPFYAIKGVTGFCETPGGIKINEHMETYDAEGKVIPGLYSAGCCAGSWEGDVYNDHMTGHLVGWALNSGRIAGESIVKYLAR